MAVFKMKLEEERKAMEPKTATYQGYSFLDQGNTGEFSALQSNKTSQEGGWKMYSLPGSL